ncbi:MAG TPA: hypothetical protein VK061_09520 [Bacillota bacterium]|nr:hypothetical protein [Bacillota bacterium]
MSITKVNKASLSLCLTGALFIAASVFLYFSNINQGISLWIDIIFFAILNIGLLVALVLGMKTKRKPIVLFSLFVNSTLFIIGLFFIFTYLFVMIT